MEQYISKSALVAEIKRLVNNQDSALDYEAALEDVLNIIDSLQEEPVSEDLGDYINELSKQFQEVSFAKLSRIAVRVAKWQKKQCNNEANHALVEQIKTQQLCYEKGMADMKQQMMKNTVDAVCYVTHYEDETQVAYSVSYPKGEETDKYHDKVKLIIIKED